MQNFILLHRFLQSRVIEKETFPVLEYTKTSTPIFYERNITQSTSTIASSQKTGNFKQLKYSLKLTCDKNLILHRVRLFLFIMV